MMRKALIAGFGQFVGFALCSHLLENGIEVDGYMNAYKDDQEQKIADEKMMLIGRNALFEKISSVTEAKENDVIFYCIQDPTDKQNRHDSTLLRECADLSIKQKIPFVLISSAEVFSEAQEKIEKDTVPHPSTENGKAHLQQESEIRELFGESNLYKIVRLPGLFGPWQPQTSFIHQCIISDLTGKKCDVEAKEEKRDILFIDDAVSTLLEIAEAHPYKESVVHLSSMKEGQWSKIAQLFSEKAERHLSYKLSKDIICPVETSVSLERGLQIQIEWIKQNLYIYQ
ncbi:NAD-dependent epimerase/dehydratase family protein [Metabacillus idriensis]|uniref:NAD-dependent epimerase/dehydratase family protein n=1 Tax=Metabacillus idriensis TaxID=324768 RepID=UPI002813B10F|nr:NAD-dependent epimerase/dehydratase family protein [Metabacillus idriensis]MDR0136441.1 NAD-dependent epimerase/dehydratase family protein [Metabacillus idriensis]